MKKILSILSLVLALAVLCACTGELPEQTTASVPTETEQTEAPTRPSFAEQENPVRYFSLSMGEDYENVLRMDVFYNEDGTVHVEYVGEEKKVGDFDANIMHGIAEAFERSGLGELNGKDSYEEGEANASMYVEFADGTMAAVGFSGTVPEAFAQGYGAMDWFFQDLTASLPVYVPQPLVMGEVEPDLLEAALEILNGSGIEALDAFTVMQIPMDDYFAFSVGLSHGEGISSAVSCAPMMMTTAYSLVIVRLEDAGDAEKVCGDFEKNLDWRKWVCVAPSTAMIAQKGDMVLCLMTYEAPDAGTPEGIRQAGWTEVKTLTNPDMQ